MLNRYTTGPLLRKQIIRERVGSGQTGFLATDLSQIGENVPRSDQRRHSRESLPPCRRGARIQPEGARMTGKARE